MIKTLTAHGNSLALVIEKPILELLDIAVDTPLRIATDGKSLIISPVEGSGSERRFADSLARVNKNHSRTLKRLAE